MESLHKQEFRVRDLPTRSVTLFPTRAQVVRDIKHVVLETGLNQISIIGLTPTIDEHSIKVEGTGSAIISDMAVELLPNRDIFEEIYPDSDDDGSDDEDSADGSDDDDADTESVELKSVRNRLTSLRDEQKRAKEVIASAESRLKILDGYGKTMVDPKHPVNIDASMETYRSERQKVFEHHMAGSSKDRAIGKAIAELAKEETRLLKLKLKDLQKADKIKAKAKKLKEKEKQKKYRREAEKAKEKARIRKERESFWPRSCYAVRITLDAPDYNTPGSSRRSSIASPAELVKPAPDNGSASEETLLTCDLSISYVTSSAYWSPSYDLQLSTTSNTASLCFDAQLTNATSESWENSKITLSTSQTTFSGLKDAIPTLVPWRVKLAGKSAGLPDNGIVVSREEQAEKGNWHATQAMNVAQQKPRTELFGHGSASTNVQVKHKAASNVAGPFQAAASYQASAAPVQQASLFAAQAPQRSGGFGSGPAQGGGLFGSSAAPPQQQYYMASVAPTGGMPAAFEDDSYSRPVLESEGFEEDNATVLEPVRALEFEESLFEETGLTATYDLPGHKSLSPSSTASKQRVARISFTNVAFSYTIVAKYKPVAFLKAKLRNTSKLTLLKGPAGLSLDGSFMGRSTLPRCSAGDSFTMSLGVDPSIRVAYPKPEVKRSTTGLFSKEDSSAYRRTITIGNTRAAAGRPVSLLVLDQVPISEDEKLRVDLLVPRGLSLGGTPVATGVPGKDGAAITKEDMDWGKATASLKKGGEVVWDVSLNAGKSVKLSLEYEVALPVGDRVIQC
ncbi:Mucoidy inhibitor-like protein [Pleurostoma richardsiae]|uniref:Mucoidy inhibitor-like protein n=1 Tax=Pleurostoma richardsiae TaxID=41990 RepID=A0AA38VDV0_9PEZI|nr:Mucoidy inhibitor-like protein [Pleurostoma richardsiae]